MSGLPPMPAGPDLNRGEGVIQMAWVECTLAIIVVACRFWARTMIKNIGWDDWIMGFSLLIFLLWGIFVTIYATMGGFRHLYFLLAGGSDTPTILMYNYIIQFVTAFAYAPAKTSVALLVLRLIPKPASKWGSWRQWVVLFTLTLVWITTVVFCVVNYAQCRPAHALWDPLGHPDAVCLDPDVSTDLALVSGIINTICDAVYAIIPATLIWRLNMDLKKRISLSILLGLGVISCACGIVKTIYLDTLGLRADPTWETYNLIQWSGSELFVLIFCGSLPSLKPLYDRYVKKTGYNSYYGRGGGGGGYGSGGRSQQLTKRLSGHHHPTVDRRRTIPSDVFELSEHGEDSIRKTTDIEVMSSDQYHHVV